MATTTDQFARIAGRVNLRLLATRTVVVVGAGTVGSQLARELANSGVGSLRLIDGDVLERHNLPRHVLTTRYVGMNKAEAMALYLADNVPTLAAEALARDVDSSLSDRALDRLLSDADLIVACTDNRRAQRRVGRRALALDVPAVFPALYPGGGGETFVQLQPGAACFFCWDGFREGNETLRAVTALNAEGLAVIEMAARLSLGLLDTRSEFARLLAHAPGDRQPPQLFVQRPFAAPTIALVPRVAECPSCAVGPAPSRTNSGRTPNSDGSPFALPAAVAAGPVGRPLSTRPIRSVQSAPPARRRISSTDTGFVALLLWLGQGLGWILGGFVILCLPLLGLAIFFQVLGFLLTGSFNL